MEKIRVHTAFDLNAPDSGLTHYTVGVHTVPLNVARHWFTQAHAEIVGGDQQEQEEVEALFQAEIADLQKQLAAALATQDRLVAELGERDITVTDLRQQLDTHTATITDLQKQMADLMTGTDSPPTSTTEPAKGAKGAKKSDAAN